MHDPQANDHEESYDRGFLNIILAFQAALVPLALGLGWLLDYSPVQDLDLSPEAALPAILWGILATVPMLVPLWFVRRSRRWPWRGLRNGLRKLRPRLRNATLGERMALAAVAGLGEELLFRGLWQSAMADWWGPPTGTWGSLVIVSCAFGLLHAVNRTYALAAAVAGAWLGLLLIWSGNLLVPILAHALYDAIALWWLVPAARRDPRPSGG